MKKKPRTPAHAYLPGESDHHPVHPQTLCGTCGKPKPNAAHQLKAQSAAVTDFEQRKTGDR